MYYSVGYILAFAAAYTIIELKHSRQICAFVHLCVYMQPVSPEDTLLRIPESGIKRKST